MNNRLKINSFLIITALSSLFVMGCNTLKAVKLEQSSQATPLTQLTVSAAASLKGAMTEIEQIYEQKYPQSEIIYNFASSGSLQRQIEQGAPVDVFISAAVNKMDALAEQELLLTETRRDLLKNQMVLIAPESNNKSNSQLDNFNDLTTEEITTVALGQPASVPAGKYAQEVLNSFQIADKVNSKAVYGKDVRQILNYVATGNVDAGVVYRTDAQGADNVRVIATAPETSHSPVIYPVAAIKDSDRPEAAAELIEFLATPEAQAVFEEYGFMTMSNE
ncbi:molybdate ABC transporter substrate-binding protein [Pleurocapsales cyanobacterium LEGE 10410]|nr:molybdate ABC transporter substrate-binding protein [Pleurocapsales cyanobacterium LEGE 10410]